MTDKEGFLSTIVVRKVNESDCMDLFTWRNDPDMRKNSIRDTGIVPLEDHKRWFAAKLKDPACRLYIGISGEDKVGLMRFEIEDDHIRVGTNVNPAYRGKGVGTRIMGLTTKKVFDEFKKPITAEIRSDNIASIKMCAKNGYVITKATKDITFMCYGGGAASQPA